MQVQLHSAFLSKGKKFDTFFSNQKYYFKLKVFQIVIYCACYLWHRKDHKTFDFISGIYFIIFKRQIIEVNQSNGGNLRI